jgi:hypothetical protein
MDGLVYFDNPGDYEYTPSVNRTWNNTDFSPDIGSSGIIALVMPRSMPDYEGGIRRDGDSKPDHTFWKVGSTTGSMACVPVGLYGQNKSVELYRKDVNQYYYIRGYLESGLVSVLSSPVEFLGTSINGATFDLSAYCPPNSLAIGQWRVGSHDMNVRFYPTSSSDRTRTAYNGCILGVFIGLDSDSKLGYNINLTGESHHFWLIGYIASDKIIMKSQPLNIDPTLYGVWQEKDLSGDVDYTSDCVGAVIECINRSGHGYACGFRSTGDTSNYGYQQQWINDGFHIVGLDANGKLDQFYNKSSGETQDFLLHGFIKSVQAGARRRRMEAFRRMN